MKNENIIHIGIYGILFLLIGFLFIQQKEAKKVALVNAQEVLEQYQGFKEAQDLFEVKTKELSKAFEEQKKKYESKSNELKILKDKLSASDLKTKEAELEVLKNKTFQLGKAIEQRAAEQEEQLLQGVYNKVNDFIERYAKSKGIDLITGVTTSGNVLYASDAIDITKEIIEGLNKEYEEGITD